MQENKGWHLEDSERNRSKAFLLLGVADYLDINITEEIQYLTDGGNDRGFDAAYIVEAQGWLDVVLFESKYSRKLDSDSDFSASTVEKAALELIWFRMQVL